MGQIVEASGLTGTNLELRFHVNPDTGEVFYKRHSLLNGKRLIRAGFIKPGTQSNGYKWVYWDKQREMWKVDIRHFSTNGTKNRKVLFHYFHSDPLVAYKAACEAAKTIFGEFYNDGCKK